MSKPVSSLFSDKAIFLDRDGVLNEDSGYTYRIEDLKIVEGVIDGLKIFRDLGYRLFVLTNQSGVARGMFTLNDVTLFHAKMAEIFRQHGIYIESFFVCPHHIEGKVPEFTLDCTCRKPHPHFVLKAIESCSLNPANCFFIGDRGSDIECGIRAGIKTVFVETGASHEDARVKSDIQARNLHHAAQLIRQQESS